MRIAKYVVEEESAKDFLVRTDAGPNTIDRWAKRVQFSCKEGARLDWDKQDAWQRSANGYSCTLSYQGRRYTFDFWQGSAHTSPPDAKGTLDCLVSDTRGAGQSFEQWCREYGDDPDSMKSHATYKACVRVGKSLQKLFGADFDRVMAAEDA